MIGRFEGKFLFFCLLALWLLINLWTAFSIGLDPDEAYYWMYSTDIDWGYFDHPPMIALLIWAGTHLIPNELGVRIGAVIAQVFAFYFIWLLADKPEKRKDVLTLFGLLLSMPMLQVYGFIATPDAPLLLFTAVYLYLYKRFIGKMDWQNTLLLGICMAALLYSKYHGLLIIGFILLSNLSLLKKPAFYLASLTGFVLFLPHLYWQYAYDFPTFAYHLQGRDDLYEIKYTLVYLLNQFILFNPFLFPLLLLSLWKNKAQNKLQRAYRFTIFGFWIFFFYTTFKGHVEPQWTAVLSFPIVLILFRASKNNFSIGWWTRRLVFLSVVLLLIARFELVWNITDIKTPFHRQSWIYQLQEEAGDLPVLFHNTYRDISKYNFYTGENAYVFTDIDYRPSQYDIWDKEAELHNEGVLMVNSDSIEGFKRLEVQRKSFFVKEIDSLQVFRKVKISTGAFKHRSLRQGKLIKQGWKIFNPYPFDIDMDNESLPVYAGVVFLEKNDKVAIAEVQLKGRPLVLPAKDTVEFHAEFLAPKLPPGTYQMGAGLNYDCFSPDVKSKFQQIIITGN